MTRSPFGWTLMAIRDNRLRAGALGIPVSQRLIAAYTLAGAISGTAGITASRRPPVSRRWTCSPSTAPPT